MLFRRLIRCTIVLALISSAGSGLTAAPQIQFESRELDFGKVPSGAPINAEFRFKNLGDAELEISAVRPGCGCTKAEAKQKKLAPGESSTIEALFNTTGFSGSVSKSITVNTNDPAQPSLFLSIKAEIVALGRLKPDRLNFGSIKVNTSRTRLLEVFPGDPATFAITQVEVLGTHVAVPSFRKVTDKAGDFWELTLVINAGKTPGRVMEWISILTNAGEKAKLLAMVYGNVVE